MSAVTSKIFFIFHSFRSFAVKFSKNFWHFPKFPRDFPIFLPLRMIPTPTPRSGDTWCPDSEVLKYDNPDQNLSLIFTTGTYDQF